MIPVIRIITLILGVTCVLVSGADLREDHSIESPETIEPRAIYDADENTSSEGSGRGAFSPYRPCRNGSGGICVKQGQCPAGSEAPSGGCSDGAECCYSPGKHDKSCKGRGGTCQSRSNCDGAVVKQRTDCDSRGQVCCVFLN